MRQVKKGSADVSVTVYIIDSSDGTPETGVVWNSAGIDLQYHREGAAAVAITEATLAALTDAHSDGGFLAIGFGAYRLDVPDAAFVTGAETVDIFGTVTGMIVLPQTIQLVDFDPEDSVRLGLTALPNAAADAAGGVPISDAGGLDLDTKLANTNEVTAARMGALTDWINGGRLDLLLDAIKAVTDLLPNGGALNDLAAILTDTGTTLEARFTGITSLAEWLGALAGKQAEDATAQTEIRATGAGSGTYDATADSLEAIRDRGDTAWITGGGGGITDILNLIPLIPVSIDLADTAAVRLALGLVNSLDDLPSTAEITPGTIDIDRKAIGGASWSSVVSGGACSEAAGIIYYDEVFDSGTGYAEGDSIRITLKSAKITVAANDYEICGTDGLMFQTVIREAMRGTDSAALASNYSAARAGYLDNINGHTAQTGDNYARLGAPAGASVSADLAAVKTDTGNLVTRITATLFAGITSLAEWLGLIAGKQAGDATALTEIKASGAGSGTYDPTTDSQEAIRDTAPLGTAMRGTDSAATAAALSTHDGKLDTVDTVVDAIKAVTDNLPDSGGLTTIGADTARLTAARAAVLTDLIDGGRLDLLIDAVKAKTDNLPSGVAKNVALANFSFLMVLSSDSVTPATGKTVTAQISKDGGAFANCTNSVSEISNGLYKINLAQTEMNADVVVLKFTETDCDQRTIMMVTDA